MPDNLETIRMAVAALRSAADDLMKTDPLLKIPVDVGSVGRLVLRQLLEPKHIVRVNHLGQLVIRIAQGLERNYRKD
jgi:hypothetical protein